MSAPAGKETLPASTNYERQPEGEPKLTVHERHERYLLTRILHLVLRPIRPALVKAVKRTTVGSPQLTAPRKVTKRCDVQERLVEGIWTYTIASKASPGPWKRRILYFNGGGWQSPPSGDHWIFCAEIACRLPDTKVTIASYPLAPNNPVSISFPQIIKAYTVLMREAAGLDEAVVVAGDSSGGNIALCVVTWAVSTPDLGVKPPAAVLAICPSTDLRHDLPEIRDKEKVDPILTLKAINSTASAWSPGPVSPDPLSPPPPDKLDNPLDWSFDDPRVSPIHADLRPIVQCGVNIHGVTGSYDVLEPDAVAFRERCKREGVSGEWLSWNGQMHCFPLAFRYGLGESKEALSWMVDVLKKC